MARIASLGSCRCSASHAVETTMFLGSTGAPQGYWANAAGIRKSTEIAKRLMRLLQTIYKKGRGASVDCQEKRRGVYTTARVRLLKAFEMQVFHFPSLLTVVVEHTGVKGMDPGAGGRLGIDIAGDSPAGGPPAL